MAKKKGGQPPQNQEKEVKAAGQVTRPAAMEDTSEKLESLKSLNSMLLKETVERRQQVDSLLQSQGSLKSELTRSKSENVGLLTELAQLDETSLRLELEMDLVFALVVVQVAQIAEVIEREKDGFRSEKMKLEERLGCLYREMKQVLIEKGEIEKAVSDKEAETVTLNKRLNELVFDIESEKDVSDRICREKDELKAKFESQIHETDELGIHLIEAESREKEIQEELWKLKNEYDAIVVEKEEKVKMIKSISRDKDLIERSLVESNGLIEDLKRKIVEITKEKEVVDDEKQVESIKRNELKNAVNTLNEMVLSLQKKEEMLQINVAELEKKCFEGEEKEKQMAMNVHALMEEKKENVKRIESLIGEKSSVAKDLDEALNQMDILKQKIETLTKEKIEVEGVRLKNDGEVVDLKKKIAKLSGDVLSLEEICRVQIDRIKQLEFEACQYRGAIDQITVDRDEAINYLNEEKQNGIILNVKIMEMEKRIEETKNAMEETKVSNFNLVGEKRVLESSCIMLKEEIASLESALLESKMGFDSAQNMVKSVHANSEILLKMLKNTAASVCFSKDENRVVNDDVSDDEQMTREEIEPFVAELVAIKKGIKKKEREVEDIRRQLESLQNSAAEAHKQKGFWAVISSATTVIAAASLAYIARGH